MGYPTGPSNGPPSGYPRSGYVVIDVGSQSHFWKAGNGLVADDDRWKGFLNLSLRADAVACLNRCTIRDRIQQVAEQGVGVWLWDCAGRRGVSTSRANHALLGERRTEASGEDSGDERKRGCVRFHSHPCWSRLELYQIK